MLTEQGPQFVLKAYLLMMFLLFANVPNYWVQIELADSKIGITSLPLELC